MLEMSYYGNFSKSEFESLPLILQRFLSYTQYDTTSDPQSPTSRLPKRSSPMRRFSRRNFSRSASAKPA